MKPRYTLVRSDSLQTAVMFILVSHPMTLNAIKRRGGILVDTGKVQTMERLMLHFNRYHMPCNHAVPRADLAGSFSEYDVQGHDLYIPQPREIPAWHRAHLE